MPLLRNEPAFATLDADVLLMRILVVEDKDALREYPRQQINGDDVVADVKMVLCRSPLSDRSRNRRPEAIRAQSSCREPTNTYGVDAKFDRSNEVRPEKKRAWVSEISRSP